MRTFHSKVAGFSLAILSLGLFSRVATENDNKKVRRNFPLVVTTWNFTSATSKAWDKLNEHGASALDAVTVGCTECENRQCDGTVGYGGSPDENGEVTLDAMLFDGTNMNMGAVGGLRNVKDAAAVARRVLENTGHSILVGSLATEFATKLGFKNETLNTENSYKLWEDWKQNKCQPNFWQNVVPDPTSSCGPYKPNPSSPLKKLKSGLYDTISMVVIDDSGNVVAGTSSNGAIHKIPGRVGDAPLPGAGAYADSKVGAGVATGDGDVMMRFLPSFLMVEMMRNGHTPKEAATEAISRIANYYPSFSGALIAVNRKGSFYATCHGIDSFPFSVASNATNGVKVFTTKCADYSHRNSV